ncbi:unnamed protein product [Pleuronectes platessa]|uniref:Uncharacterized protein n=1 Tax=Pleuronectes platessa TaxID=8262 RepID=A0A9N7UBJ7_PLEPL|nr:unnamed protein product [Pleuronectes platessa]
MDDLSPLPPADTIEATPKHVLGQSRAININPGERERIGVMSLTDLKSFHTNTGLEPRRKEGLRNCFQSHSLSLIRIGRRSALFLSQLVVSAEDQSQPHILFPRSPSPFLRLSLVQSSSPSSLHHLPLQSQCSMPIGAEMPPEIDPQTAAQPKRRRCLTAFSRNTHCWMESRWRDERSEGGMEGGSKWRANGGILSDGEPASPRSCGISGFPLTADTRTGSSGPPRTSGLTRTDTQRRRGEPLRSEPPCTCSDGGTRSRLPFSARRVLRGARLGGRHLPATIRWFLAPPPSASSALLGRGAAAVRCALTAMRHGAWKQRAVEQAGTGLQQLRHAGRSEGEPGVEASQIPLCRSAQAQRRLVQYRGISCMRSGGGGTAEQARQIVTFPPPLQRLHPGPGPRGGASLGGHSPSGRSEHFPSASC